MLRQPLRTALLVFLIGLATFAFFLRTAEFLTVREQVNELGRLHRPIGLLHHEYYWGDVSQAAELIAQSRDVEFIDRRMGVEGVLTNMYSPDITGMMPWIPYESRPRITEAVFAATVNDFWLVEELDGYFVWISLLVEEVYAGFNEYVAPRRMVFVQHFFEHGEDMSILNQLAVRRAIHLFRGSHYMRIIDGFAAMPSVGSPTLLNLRPLYEGGPLIKTLSSPDLSGVFYRVYDEAELQSLMGYMVDIRYQTLEGNTAVFQPHTPAELPWYSSEDFWVWTTGFEIPEEISDIIPPQVKPYFEYLERHTRTVYLQTTRDMSSMPSMQRGAPFRLAIGNPVGQYLYMLNRGRLLTYHDYETANPVTVISSQFGWIRGVGLGDIIEVKVPLSQEIVGLTPAHREFIVRGVPGETAYYTLELEVVGVIFDFMATEPWVPGTVSSAFMYIPESVLPEGLTIAQPSQEAIPGWNYPYHIPSAWYNFVLYDSRAEQAFQLEYGPLLRELGVSLIIFESRSADFWAVVDPMLLMVTFNAIVFWVVLLLVLALVVFLFLSQRRKDIAIQQGLGFTPKRVLLRLIAALLVFGVPAILAGGFIGWNIAVETTTYTLEPLGEFIQGFTPNVEFSWTWFVFMGLIVLAIALAMLLAGALFLTSFPVLNQLQGVFSRPKSKKKKRVSNVTILEVVTEVSSTISLPKMDFATSKVTALFGRLRWVMRQIRRAKLKSALALAVALFFVLVMGWLNESIVRTEDNVEQLLQYTVVNGEIQTSPFFVTHQAHVTTGMPRYIAERVIEGGYFGNFVMAGGHARSFVIPLEPEGFPENWYDAIGYDITMPIMHSVDTLDTLFAFNNFDLFMADNYLEGFGGLEIEFLPGYDGTRLEFTYGEPIPVIVPESLLERRGIGLGDVVYIGYTTYAPSAVQYIYAHVIGVHNMFVVPTAAQEATLMPLDALEHMLGEVVRYNLFNFTIAPEYNRYLDDVTEFVYSAIGGRYFFQIWDEAINNLVGIASQTLLLLTLIYPIALGASVIIAGGLSMLLMLQNAKSAAILHVVGTSKKRTMAMLLLEQLIICMGGVVPGLIALALMGVSFDMALLMAMALYMGSVTLGATIGAVMVINRPPLALLQVKE